MKSTASMLDWGKQGLDPAVFDDQGKLKPEHKEHILSKLYKKLEDAGLQHYAEWIDTIHIIGSLTSYRYAKATDVDIHPVVNLEKFLEAEEQELDFQGASDLLNELGKELSREETEVLDGTNHEMEYYFETYFFEDGEQLWITLAETTEGDYDVLTEEWTKDPLFVDYDWDADTIYSTVLEEAKDLANEFDVNIGEIKRELTDIDLLEQSLQSFKNQPKQSKFFLEKIEEKIDTIEADILEMADKGEAAHDERVEQFEGNDEDLAKGVKFKYLQRYGYIWLYKQLKKLFEEETPPELTLDEIPQVKKIIKEFKMSENLFQILSVLKKQASHFKDEASYIESSVLKELGMTPPSAGVVPVFVQGSTEGKEFISVVATDGELKGQRFKVSVADLHKLSFNLDEYSNEYQEAVREYFMEHPEAKMDTVETASGIRQAMLGKRAKNVLLEKEKDFNTFKQFFVDAQLSAVEDWYTERCPEVYAAAIELKKQEEIESKQIQDLYKKTIASLNGETEPLIKDLSSFNSGSAAVPAKKTSSFDSQTYNWIKAVLINDEASTDEQLVQHFIKEGPMTKEEAEWWVGKRNEFLACLPQNEPDFEEEFERAFPDEEKKEASLTSVVQSMEHAIAGGYAQIPYAKRQGNWEYYLDDNYILHVKYYATEVITADFNAKKVLKVTTGGYNSVSTKAGITRALAELKGLGYEVPEMKGYETEASINKQPVKLDSDENSATVRCNNCGWEGVEEDLKLFKDKGEFVKGCPNCDHLDHALMDIKRESKFFINKQSAKLYNENPQGVFNFTLELEEGESKAEVMRQLQRASKGNLFMSDEDRAGEGKSNVINFYVYAKSLEEAKNVFSSVLGSLGQKAKLSKQSSSIGIDYQSKFTTEEEDEIKDHVCERIADAVLEGYSEGEIFIEELSGDKAVKGWFKIDIEEDENEEDVRNAEVARLIRKGYSSGYNPTFEWSANVWDLNEPEGKSKKKKAKSEHSDIVQMMQIDNNLFVAKDRDGHVKYQGTRDEVNKWIDDRKKERGDSMQRESVKKEQVFLSYDESDIAEAEVEFRMSEPGEFDYILDKVEYEKEDGTTSDLLTLYDEVGHDSQKFIAKVKELGLWEEFEEKVREQVYKDTDFLQFAWQDLITELDSELKKRSPSGVWYVKGRNMGWQHREGDKSFKADSAEEWLKAILPNTDTSFDIYELPNNGLKMVVFHHDAPTGETYEAYPKEACAICGEPADKKIKGDWYCQDCAENEGIWPKEKKESAKLFTYNVMLDGKEIDTVFYKQEQDPEEVKNSLIDHDGYDPRIVVVLEGKKEKALWPKKARLDFQIIKEATRSFKDIKELQKEVQDNDLHPGDYIKVGGVEYVMVEYSAISYKRPGGGGGSRYVSYADSDTLTKEINIDYEEKTVREDEAMIDWTEKIAPKIKKESEVVQAPPFKEWWVDNKVKPEYKQQYEEYAKQETDRGEKPRSYDEWASDYYDAMLEKSTTASLIRKSIKYSELPDFKDFHPEELEEGYRLMDIDYKIWDSLGALGSRDITDFPEKKNAYLEEIQKRFPNKIPAKFYKLFENENYHLLNEALSKLDLFVPHIDGITYYQLKASLERKAYVEKVPGHKNSKGELAEWVIKSHETDKILSSHKTEEAANQHLKDMHAHS